MQPFALPFATGDLGYRLPDGRIFLLGRRDLVVKIHGYRVHLAEVESAVSGVQGIVEAAAVVRPAPSGDATVVAYYVGADGDVDAAALHRAMSAALPAIPIAFVQLPALPRLPGGKVNRSNLMLEHASAAASASEEPSYASPTEAALASIWREALNVPAMARGDDFFDLGGDSISVFRVLSQIKQRFGVDLTVRDFFAHAVLAELARAIDARRTG